MKHSKKMTQLFSHNYNSLYHNDRRLIITSRGITEQEYLYSIILNTTARNYQIRYALPKVELYASSVDSHNHVGNHHELSGPSHLQFTD